MNSSQVNQPSASKRKLLNLAALWPLTACTNPAGAGGLLGRKDDDPQRRFRGIGMILVVDAVLDVEMKEVVFSDDRSMALYSPSLVAKRSRAILALGGARVPLTVRTTWGIGRHYDFGHATWYGGTIIGDFTIPVASRIPDEVLQDIRAHGGALRLKFRLKPDGVLFGWDIERGIPIPNCKMSEDLTCTGTAFFSPGGDFLETRY